MNELLMIIAFLILTGLGLLVLNLLDLNLIEGIYIAVIIVIITISFTVNTPFINLGFGFIGCLSIAGFILMVRGCIKRSNNTVGYDKTNDINYGIPAFLVLFVLFCISIVLYHGDFIQHYDELHFWGLLTKYLVNHRGMEPVNGSFSNSNTKHALCYFIYFFQRIAGYNEGMMYASSALLFWIAILLPFGGCEKKCIWKIAIYCLIVYFALYSFYPYGTKNIYVDIPVASWTGGLLAWISQNKETKLWKQFVFIFPALFIIFKFKPSLGWMLDVFILSFAIINYVANKLKVEKNIRHLCDIIFILINLAYTFLIISVHYILLHINDYSFLPQSVRESIINKGINKQKVLLTLTSFVNSVQGDSLSAGKSSLDMTFISGAALCAVIMYVAHSSSSENKTRIDLFFVLTIIYIYIGAVYYGFLFRFSYSKSIKTTSSIRYNSIIIITMFILAMNWIMHLKGPYYPRQLYTCMFLIVIFLSGLNTNFLANSTSWDPAKVKGYYDMSEVRQEASIIKSLLKEEDKVYFINQSEIINEYASDEALYELYPQISDFRIEPWQFHMGGSYIWEANVRYLTLDNFPDYLTSGHYSYLWIYNVDSFIKNRLPEVFEMDDDVTLAKGQLFKIQSGNEKMLKIVLVKNLLKFDNRRNYLATIE